MGRAEARELSSAVPNWTPSYEIHSANKTLRVVGVRDNDADQPPTLVLGMHKPRAQSHLSGRSPKRRAAKATPPNVEGAPIPGLDPL